MKKYVLAIISLLVTGVMAGKDAQRVPKQGEACINQNFEGIRGTWSTLDNECLPKDAVCVKGRHAVTVLLQGVPVSFDKDDYGLWNGKQCNAAEIGARCLVHWLGKSHQRFGMFSGSGCQLDGMQCVNEAGIWSDKDKKCNPAVQGAACKTFDFKAGTYDESWGRCVEESECPECTVTCTCGWDVPKGFTGWQCEPGTSPVVNKDDGRIQCVGDLQTRMHVCKGYSSTQFDAPKFCAYFCDGLNARLKMPRYKNLRGTTDCNE
jgi:hypothetical protein